MRRRLAPILPKGMEYTYVGREFRASPGEGYAAAHRAEQRRIVEVALDVIRGQTIVQP
jgi:2-oxoglutarate dehydrogenase E1 component